MYTNLHIQYHDSRGCFGQAQEMPMIAPRAGKMTVGIRMTSDSMRVYSLHGVLEIFLLELTR